MRRQTRHPVVALGTQGRSDGARVKRAGFGSPLAELPRWRLLLLVASLATATYANALGNTWAFDDDYIVVSNPVVTETRWSEALTGPYWGGLEAVPSLYRPTTVTAFALEWSVFEGRPSAFHAVSLLLHVLVSLFVTLLLAAFLPAAASAAGGALFAVHPVHVEAVANVVGQSELLAAAAYLGACLLYIRHWSAGPGVHALRLLAITALYALALGAKEIAVTLPAALLLVELVRVRAREYQGTRPGALLIGAVRRDAPLYLALVVVLLAYLGVRVLVLGSLRGESLPSELIGLDWGARLLTALSLWPTYARLMLMPWNLAVDYAPGVLAPGVGLRPQVIVGAMMLATLSGIALRSWRVAPWAAFAAAWMVVTILPVSNLVVPSGTMLGERTLYLPSVAVAIAVAGVLTHVGTRHPVFLRRAWGGVAVVVTAFMIRSALRNPSWYDSFTAMNTLALEHPESWRSHRSRAEGLVRVGELDGALEEYEAALTLVPLDYSLLCEAGEVYLRQRRWPRAEELLTTAVTTEPDRPTAYRLLSQLYLVAGDGRKAHGTALAGLARWGTDRQLWALVSESYVAKGDLPAAVRAREAALGADPSSEWDRTRLAELLEAVGTFGESR